MRSFAITPAIALLSAIPVGEFTADTTAVRPIVLKYKYNIYLPMGANEVALLNNNTFDDCTKHR